MLYVYIHKYPGYKNIPTPGTFTLSFEDADTSPIDVSASVNDTKRTLEELKKIFTVNVETFSYDNQNVWVITFTEINENGCGVGDVNLIEAKSLSLSDQTVTSVRVVEMSKELILFSTRSQVVKLVLFAMQEYQRITHLAMARFHLHQIPFLENNPVLQALLLFVSYLDPLLS